jgi:hypothetical protein
MIRADKFNRAPKWQTENQEEVAVQSSQLPIYAKGVYVMSQDQEVHVKSEIKQDKFSRMKSPTLWIGVLALVVLAIWAFGTASAYEALNEPAGGNSLSLNPELSAARRYAEVAARGRESGYLAISPELKSVRIYAEVARSESTYSMAANPELKVAQRYAESAKEVQEKSSAWVANPELSAANRFAETSAAGIEEVNLYQNPELKVVASQAAIMYEAYDSDFLTTNPEIKAHQHFVESIGK